MMITYFNFQRFHNYFLMAQNEFIQKLYQSAHFTRWDFSSVMWTFVAVELLKVWVLKNIFKPKLMTV